MKILVFNWQDIKNPLSGGAEVHLHELFSRIARLGNEVTLFCSAFPDAPREEIVDGIRVIRRGKRNTFNFIVPFAYLFRFRHEDFDVVVDDINKIPFYTPLYVRKPLVGIVHHLFGKTIFKEVNFIAALYVYLSEKLIKSVYRNTMIAVVSESTRREMEIIGFPQHQLPFVRNCVEHNLYKPTGGEKSPTPLIGTLGRLKKYKSIDHLLNALVRVRKEIPGVKLCIVGEGDDRPRLERIVHELDLHGVVSFAGFVSNEEKVRLVQEMWFVVNPSSKEGWGLTVLEANACGTPCIASDVPGLHDSVRDGETGLLYEYGNIAQLSTKILLLLRQRELRDHLRKGALAWAQNFHWDREAEVMVKVLKETLSLNKQERIGKER